MEERTSQDGTNLYRVNENTNQDSQVGRAFTADSTIEIEYPPQTWYQQNLDIVLPLVIIAIGLFQYVLRKWVLPVDKDLVFDLEDQSPGQGILLLPGFGVFIMLAGIVMLVLFNLDHIF